MLKKIKTFLILVLLCAVCFLLFQGSTFLDSKLENKPTSWVEKVPDTIAPASANTPTVEEYKTAIETGMYKTEAVVMPLDDSSPEIVNTDYSWLQSAVKRCHPLMKGELKSAIANDGIIRQNEYRAIMNRCVEYNEQESAGDKAELKRFLAE